MKPSPIKNRLHRHWPLLLGLLLTAIPMVALADTPAAVTQAFELFNIILTGMQAVLWPILLMMGGLLNNDLLFSGGMQTILLNIWTAVRDFVNILFVLGLLAVAIMNIFGAGGDDYSIKKILPKIAISLIAVNFSFLACKVILDAVNVTTTAIYAIPMASDSLAKYSDPAQQESLSQKFCSKIMSIKGVDEKSIGPYCKIKDQPVAASGTDAAKPATYQLSDLGKSFFQRFNSQNVALVLAMELMSITTIDNVNATVTLTTKDLTIQTLFSIIFLVIYATSFIALFAVLLVRVVVLWITIATLPISFIGMAFSKVKDKIGANDPWKLFLSHATIPIQVAVVLTIGMIMISQLKQINSGVQYSTDPNSLNTYTASATSLQDMIAGLATAAFIWTAAFAAMQGTKADGMVNKIKGSVEGFGKSLIKLPAYMPLIPVGKKGADGKQQMVGLAALAGGIGGGGLEDYYNKQRGEWGKVMGSATDRANSILGGIKTKEEAPAKIAEALREVNYKPDKAMQAKIAELITTHNLKDKIVVPAASGAKNSAEFIEGLKAGKYENEAVFKEFLANEKNKAAGFVAGATETKPAIKAGDDAMKLYTDKAGGTSSGVPELDKAAKELGDNLQQLKNDKTGEKSGELVPKITELAARVKALSEAKDSIGKGFTAASVIKDDGTLFSGSAADNLKTKSATWSPDTKAAMRPMLIEKFQAQLKDHDPKKAEALVDQIIAQGQAAPALKPAAPPAKP